MNYKLLVFLFIHNVVFGQVHKPNLIPNPSFELNDKTPLGWFYNGTDFSEVVRHWYSPTTASPDTYNPRVIVPKTWKEKGFGNASPKTGEAMIGITAYGCNTGKSHCREYAAVRIKEKMVVGQEYQLTFHLKHMPKSIHIQNIGAALSTQKIVLNNDSLLSIPTVSMMEKLDITSDYQWIKVSSSFMADSTYQYLIIGNFVNDDDTKTIQNDKSIGYGYYYIDDVELIKKPPFINSKDHRIDIPLQPNEIFVLNGVYFSSSSAYLTIESIKVLENLINVLNNQPEIGIEIHGHTDDEGGFEFNQNLSIRRAESVRNYLTQKGISKNRLIIKGFGETRPVNNNTTANERQYNRRIEIVPYLLVE